MTIAAKAALRAMVLGDSGGSSSNDGSCCDSGGKDDGNGGSDVGENCPCCPCRCPLCHPPHRCHRQRPCCHHRHRIYCRPHHCPLSPQPAAITIALSFHLYGPLCCHRQRPSLMPSPLLLLLSQLPSLLPPPPLSSTPATLLLSQLRMLSPLPSPAHNPCCRSHCFLCHHQCHRRLIALSKWWAIATAAAMAALRAMALGNCGGSSSNEDRCCDSGGKD